MTDRRIIIDALLNSNKEDDLRTLLFKALELKESDKSPIQVVVEDETVSAIIKKLYPFISVTIGKPKEGILFLTKGEPTSILSYKVSEYKNDGYFNIGFEDGIYVNKIDHISKFLNPNPYTICCTDHPDYFQRFLKIVKQVDKKNKSIDIFIPKKLVDVLYKVDFTTIQKHFKSIMIENIDGTVQSICFNEAGNTLRIKPIPETVEWGSFVSHSIDHIFIDSDFCTVQPLIDTIVNFQSKFVWTNQSESYKEFLIHLRDYTHSTSIKTFLCFQYDQPLPDVFTLIKPKMDKVIKLGMLYPNIKDIIDIIHKNVSIQTKLDRLNKLK